MESPLLSILVISHNQEVDIARCLDSILAQKLTCDFEIIVSDDNSSDRTWEVISAYKDRYPHIVKPYKFNSGDYNPTIPSERCGLNKINAYKHSSGKYMVFVDGDDYLINDNIYQTQINYLENNPEVYLCKHDMKCVVEEDRVVKKSWIWGLSRNGTMSVPEFFLGAHYVSNPAFMIRRDKYFKPGYMLSKLCNDEFITYHFLRYGDIHCIGMDGYAYVLHQKGGSIDASYTDDNKLVKYVAYYLLAVSYYPFLAAYVIESNKGKLVKFMKALLSRKLSISGEMQGFIQQFDICAFSYLFHGQVFGVKRLRLWIARCLLLMSNILKLRWWAVRYLYVRLMTSKNIVSATSKKDWIIKKDVYENIDNWRSWFYRQ